MSAISDFLKQIGDQIIDSGKVVVSGAADKTKAEGYAKVLWAVFNGKPRYYQDQSGRWIFVWEGRELESAKQRVRDILKGDPNSPFAPQYSQIFLPVALEKLALPAAIIGAWFILRKR